MSRLLMILPAALLLLAGCSGGDEPSSPPSDDEVIGVEYVEGTYPEAQDDLIDLYVGDHPEEHDLSEGACFASELMSRIDLRDAGLLTTDDRLVAPLPQLDEATATAWVDAELSCVSYVDAATRALLVQSKGAVDADAFGTCLENAISDDQVRAALVDLLSGGYNTAEVGALTTAQADCASASR